MVFVPCLGRVACPRGRDLACTSLQNMVLETQKFEAELIIASLKFNKLKSSYALKCICAMVKALCDIRGGSLVTDV